MTDDDTDRLLRNIEKRFDRQDEEREAAREELRRRAKRDEPEPFGPARVARAYEQIEREVEESGATTYEERQAALRRAQKGGK